MQLHDAFVKTLENHGILVLPTDDVVNSRSYEKYIFAAKGKSSVLDYVNPFGSDTGRIRRTESYSARGYALIVGAVDQDIAGLSRYAPFRNSDGD